jgi:DNA polymerase III delta prime subunit
MIEKIAEIENKLTKLFSDNQLHHANLIYGRKGLGKYRFTKNLIDKFLDNKNDFHPDFLEITKESDKKEITIDKIRELSSFITKTTAIKNYKFILINSACELNKSSANALLKVLEEPIQNNYFILLANNLNQILPTIKSRCNLIKFPEPNLADFRNLLSKELTKIDDQEIDFLAKITDLAFLKAINNGENLIFLYRELTKSIAEKSISENLLKKITEKNFVFTNIQDVIIFLCYRFVGFQSVINNEYFFDERKAFCLMSEKFSSEKFYQIKEEILHLSKNTISLNLDKKSFLINIFNILC